MFHHEPEEKVGLQYFSPVFLTVEGGRREISAVG
jgi:hypothetical protein